MQKEEIVMRIFDLPMVTLDDSDLDGSDASVSLSVSLLGRDKYGSGKWSGSGLDALDSVSCSWGTSASMMKYGI